MINEPGKREVTIRNSDLAKFGTKAEKQKTDLKYYAERRPKAPTEITTEELIIKHARDAKKKIEGEKKHRCITDDTSCISSNHSNVSRVIRVRMPTMPEKLNVPAPPKQPNQLTSAIAPQLTLTQSTPVIAEQIIKELPRRPQLKVNAKTTTTQQPSQKRHRTSPSIAESDESIISTQTCPQHCQPVKYRRDRNVNKC